MERRVKERLIGACILVVLAVALVPELLSGPKPAVPKDAAVDALRLPTGAPDPVRNVTVDLATAKPAVAGDEGAGGAEGSAAAQPASGASSAASRQPGVADASAAPRGAAPMAGGAENAGAQTAGAPTSGAPDGGQTAGAPGRAPGSASPATGPSTTSGGGAPSAHLLETPAAPPTSARTFALQLGSFANRANAERMAQELKGQGFAIYVNAEGSGAGARYRVRMGPLADRDAAERMIAKLKGLGHAATLVSQR